MRSCCHARQPARVIPLTDISLRASEAHTNSPFCLSAASPSAERETRKAEGTFLFLRPEQPLLPSNPSLRTSETKRREFRSKTPRLLKQNPKGFKVKPHEFRDKSPQVSNTPPAIHTQKAPSAGRLLYLSCDGASGYCLSTSAEDRLISQCCWSADRGK